MFSCRQNAFLLSPDSRQERTTCSICSSVCFMITVFHKAKHKLPSCKDVLARVLTKELLGLYIGESEGAKFWMQVLTDLQSRGVQDIFIACIDNLQGFADAVEALFPQTEVQLCVIHHVRNSRKYLAWKDVKPFIRDLQQVYKAATKESAERYLDQLQTNWHGKYPKVIESWRRHWDRLSNYFQYPKEIRKIIYTTNIIEGFHRQLRSVTKSKGAFTSEEALMKLLFLVQEDICSKWNRPAHNWNQTLSQLAILFGDRLKLGI